MIMPNMIYKTFIFALIVFLYTTTMNKAKILVVDDNSGIRAALQNLCLT